MTPSAENSERARRCPVHRFAADRSVPRYGHGVCLNCGGYLVRTDIAQYLQGFLAAGGKPADVHPSWRDYIGDGDKPPVAPPVGRRALRPPAAEPLLPPVHPRVALITPISEPAHRVLGAPVPPKPLKGPLIEDMVRQLGTMTSPPTPARGRRKPHGAG